MQGEKWTYKVFEKQEKDYLFSTEGGKRMTDKEKKDLKDKVYRLLAELLADQMGGTLVSLEPIEEPNKEGEANCG